ncbi:hypothetical protein ACFU8Q_38660 [Streptomyces sp. NPDC057543]|uniref:hypothetical protein n=1 Tax=Streptomyces sp. NPDC057543 TaxID=3346163 RepID=UPI0036853C27
MTQALPLTPSELFDARIRQEAVAVGAPKDVAGGVPSSVRSDQSVGDGRYPIAWLTISAPRGAVPTATSICECGRNLFAAGRNKALALIDDHNRHRTRCPLRTTEERNAS